MRTLGLALVALLGLGCVRQPLRGQEVHELDRKLATFAYIEEGDLATIIVDVHATRDRLDAPYIPLEIAVANLGLKQLTLTRESFTLVGPDGKRYPLATPRELIDGYEFLDLDRQLTEIENFSLNRFAAKTRYPSRFSPTRGPVIGSAVVYDLVALPKHGYMIDLLHFPRPTGELRGKRLELHIDTQELGDPLFVAFEVR